MSSDIAIRVKNVGKCYEMYGKPSHRLWQTLSMGKKKFYKEFWALQNISFEVKRGECVGIIGRNGSGKSTLLQIITGTLNPTIGNVEVYGRVAALLELGSGFNPEFTGRENVYMNATILGLTKAEIDAKYDEIVAFADIGEFIDQPVKTYSSGMMVRLAFAVAINVDPQIMIVDEALSVGDERFQRKCFSRIEAIRKSGSTILFVSHSGSTIVDLCDHAILLDAGEKLAMGIPKQIVGRYQKLLYAPADKQPAIREQIRRMNEQFLVSGQSPEVKLHNQADTSQSSRAQQEETFDPYLKPTSTIEYETHGVKIETPMILTLEGVQVNNLVRGRTYCYSYKVHFEKSACNVLFSMLIKTITGVELGGCASARLPQDSLPCVEAGAVYSVEFRFCCALNAGVYFLNAGVRGDINGAEGYLHRLVDIAMFRVMPDTDGFLTSIVDFGFFPEIEQVLIP